MYTRRLHMDEVTLIKNLQSQKLYGASLNDYVRFSSPPFIWFFVLHSTAKSHEIKCPSHPMKQLQIHVQTAHSSPGAESSTVEVSILIGKRSDQLNRQHMIFKTKQQLQLFEGMNNFLHPSPLCYSLGISSSRVVPSASLSD